MPGVPRFEDVVLLTPDEISSRQFLVSLRGYDREEVGSFLQQVAEEFGHLQRRVQECEAELERARAQAEPAPATPSEAEPAPATPSEAEPATDSTEPHEAFRALGEETTRILVAAEESARAITERAEEQARETLESARGEAREEVESARLSASKLVAEAERHRDQIAEEIRNLEALRDRFVAELGTAVEHTRAALRELGQAGTEGQPSTGGDTGGQSSPGGDLDTAGADEQAGTAPSGAAPADPVTGPTVEAATSPGEQPEVGDTEAPGIEAPDIEAPDAEAPDAEAPDAEAPDAEAPDAEMQAPGAGTESELTGEVVFDDGTESVRLIPGGSEVSEEAPASEPEEAPAPESEEAPAPEPEEAPVPEPPGDAGVDEAARARQLREQSLAGVRPLMLRRLKRALQDVQNGVLDALRRTEARGGIEDLLPGDDDLDPLANVSESFLSEAYRAGVYDGVSLAGEDRETATVDSSVETTRVATARATFGSVLAHEVLAALRATLGAGLEADEPASSLSERVGEVFRDLKGPVIEQSVDEHLTRAYGRGTVDAWRQLGVAGKVWLPGVAPRCPEEMRGQNADAGPLGVDDEFPTGQVVPPAHDGCDCTLAPRTAAPER